MAFSPVTGQPVQYSTEDNELASGYYLKLYDANTTVPYSMAVDSTGVERLAKAKLNDEGYPISNPLDNETVFVPHTDQDYRMVLYRNETDADNNTTANAAWNVDSLRPDASITQDASDITLRNVTLLAQDDYDRSPLFVDGNGFTAGLGPHVITVPVQVPAWTPNNPDTRFYRLESDGTLTSLTPTSSDATTFTLAETLLSTDTIYIGDDNFRNQMDGGGRAAAEAGHIRAGNTQLWDGRTAPASSFDVDSALTSGTWETVGGTISGADNIWTAMDVIPSNAVAIIVDIELQVSTSGAGPASLEVHSTDGGDPTPDTADSNIIGVVQIDANSANSLSTITIRTALPLGTTNQDFNLYWGQSAAVGRSIRMRYRGFMTDS